MFLTIALFSFLPEWGLANLDPYPGVIDLGRRTCEITLTLCPTGYEVPVIRTKEELDRIYAHSGYISNLHNYIKDKVNIPGYVNHKGIFSFAHKYIM